jgi:hypothetical protein
MRAYKKLSVASQPEGLVCSPRWNIRTYAPTTQLSTPRHLKTFPRSEWRRGLCQLAASVGPPPSLTFSPSSNSEIPPSANGGGACEIGHLLADAAIAVPLGSNAIIVIIVQLLSELRRHYPTTRHPKCDLGKILGTPFAVIFSTLLHSTLPRPAPASRQLARGLTSCPPGKKLAQWPEF